MSIDITMANFFIKSLSREAAQIRIDAYNQLDALNTDLHDIKITELLARQDLDSLAIIDLIDQAILLTQDDRLLQFGVQVIDTCNIKMRFEILHGILEIEYYLNPEDLVTLIGDGSPEDTLTDILTYLTPYTALELRPFIYSVSPFLIDRIKDILVDGLEEPETTDVISSYATRIGEHLKRMPADQQEILRVFVETSPMATGETALTINQIMALYGNDLLMEKDLFFRGVKIAILWLLSSDNTGQTTAETKERLKYTIGLLPMSAQEGIETYRFTALWVTEVFYDEQE